MLSRLRFGGTLRAGEVGTGLDPKSFFCTALDREARAEREMRRANPNEPKGLKLLVINKIAREPEKRTQASYHPWYQSLTAILPPILRKFVWIASALLRIRGYDPALVAAEA
jgi:hypothetical protein